MFEAVVTAQFRYFLTRETGVELYPPKRGSRNKFTQLHTREVYIKSISTVIVLFREVVLFYLL